MKKKTRDAYATFERIVQEHRQAVFAVAYTRLRNAHDAEDVMHDVFVEALRKLHALRKPERVLPWLFKAVSYRCKDHVRKATRREAREEAFAASASSNPSTDTLSEEERRKAVIGAVDTLQEKYRILVMLKYFGRLSYADISQMTGLSKTTIDGRLRIAKTTLRHKLTEAQKELIESGDM